MMLGIVRWKQTQRPAVWIFSGRTRRAKLPKEKHDRWMNSSVTSKFWREYVALPEDIRRKARKAFELWRRNPRHHLCILSAKALTGRCGLIAVGAHWLGSRTTPLTG
jgi:hypothetical protein